MGWIHNIQNGSVSVAIYLKREREPEKLLEQQNSYEET